MERKANWSGHVLNRASLLHDIIRGKIEGPKTMQIINDRTGAGLGNIEKIIY